MKTSSILFKTAIALLINSVIAYGPEDIAMKNEQAALSALTTTQDQMSQDQMPQDQMPQDQMPQNQMSQDGFDSASTSNGDADGYDDSSVESGRIIGGNQPSQSATPSSSPLNFDYNYYNPTTTTTTATATATGTTTTSSPSSVVVTPKAVSTTQQQQSDTPQPLTANNPTSNSRSAADNYYQDLPYPYIANVAHPKNNIAIPKTRSQGGWSSQNPIQNGNYHMSPDSYLNNIDLDKGGKGDDAMADGKTENGSGEIGHGSKHENGNTLGTDDGSKIETGKHETSNGNGEDGKVETSKHETMNPGSDGNGEDDGFSTSANSSTSSPVQYSPKELDHIKREAAAAVSEDGSMATGHNISYGNGESPSEDTTLEEMAGSDASKIWTLNDGFSTLLAGLVLVLFFQ